MRALARSETIAMVIAASEPQATQQPTGEQRVVLRGLSWEAYLAILNALPETRGARLTYDDGALEIAVPLEDQELYRSLSEYFIRGLVELMGLPIKAMGSTTINDPSLQKGAEPDNAYYIRNQPLVKGRNVDFAQDPPPDLVVEVDMTHTDIAKNQLYASLGVPEFWRFDGRVWRIYALESGVYAEVERSSIFPAVPKAQLYAFLARAREDEVGAMRALRAWWAEQAQVSE